MARDAIIAPQTEGKGRSFRALCLASVEADLLWEGGQAEVEEQRPVWSMFAASEQELRPFMANLRTGRRCDLAKGSYHYGRKAERMTLLKSAGYNVTWQREPEGSIATAFLPDLFQMDPGMVDPAGATFVLLHTKAWAQAQQIDTSALVRHVSPLIPKGYDKKPVLSGEDLAEMVPTAFLFASYLDRRTRCPLLSDGRFYLQLMLACLREGLASLPMRGYSSHEFGVHSYFRFYTMGTEELGFSKGVAFRAGHPEIERVLAEQVTLFFDMVGGR